MSSYDDNPQSSYLGYLVTQIEPGTGTVNRKQIRFDDLETGMAEDETFITIAEFIVTVKRTAQAPHVKRNLTSSTLSRGGCGIFGV